MRQLAEPTAQSVVLFVVHRLEVVPCCHLVFAVAAIGFVGVKVDLSEESACR